jgi:hypothetical protein
MILRGSLENFGLVLIALLSADLKATSWLRLTGNRLSAELALQDGRVVWAACGTKRGLSALDAVVLALDDATFQFEVGPAPLEQNLGLTVGELLTHLLSLGAARAVRRRSAGLAGLARTRVVIGTGALVALGVAVLLIFSPVSSRLAELAAAGMHAQQLASAPLVDPPPELSASTQALAGQPATRAQPAIDLRFASQSQGWPIKPPFATWSDGAYRLVARSTAQFVAVEAPVQPAQDNVVINATFRKTGGPPGGGYGIIVRHQTGEPLEGSFQGGQYYVLEATDHGQVGVWRRDDDRWVDLLSWTHADAVQTGGAANELGVRTIGQTLVFVVNGVEVTRQTDAALPSSGGVGIFVGGDGNEVAVDRFTLAFDQ